MCVKSPKYHFNTFFSKQNQAKGDVENLYWESKIILTQKFPSIILSSPLPSIQNNVLKTLLPLYQEK